MIWLLLNALDWQNFFQICKTSKIWKETNLNTLYLKSLFRFSLKEILTPIW